MYPYLSFQCCATDPCSYSNGYIMAPRKLYTYYHAYLYKTPCGSSQTSETVERGQQLWSLNNLHCNCTSRPIPQLLSRRLRRPGAVVSPSTGETYQQSKRRLVCGHQQSSHWGSALCFPRPQGVAVHIIRYEVQGLLIHRAICGPHDVKELSAPRRGHDLG